MRRASIVLALWACAPDAKPFEAGEGLIVAAIADREGRVLSAGTNASAALTKGDESLVLFSIPADEVELPDGVPPAAVFAVLEKDTAPEGSCGRCVGMTSTLPWRLIRGDACRIPLRARASVDGEWIEDGDHSAPLVAGVRQQVRIAVPGPCAFPSVSIAPTASARVTEMVHPQRGLQSGLTAIGFDGSVLEVGWNRLTLTSSTGATRTREFTLGRPEIPIPLLDGSFFLAISTNDSDTEWRSYIVDRTLAVEPALGGSPPLRLKAIVAAPPEDRLIIYGEHANLRAAAAYACSRNEETWSCRDLLGSAGLDLADEVASATSVGDSLAFFAGTFDRRVDNDRATSLAVALVELDGSRVRRGTITTLPGQPWDQNFGVLQSISFGGFVHLLVIEESGGEMRFVSRRVSPELLDPSAGERLEEGWMASTSTPADNCRSSTRFGSAMLLICDSGRAAELLEDGSVSWVRSSSVLGLEGTVNRLQRAGPWTLATDGLSVLRAENSAAFTIVRAPELASRTHLEALAEADEGLLAFGAKGFVIEIDPTKLELTHRQLDGLPSRPMAAVSSRGRTFVAGRDGSGEGIVSVIQGSSVSSVRGQGWGVVTALAAVDSEVLGLTREGVAVIDPPGAPVKMSWDDPRTDPIETVPDGCTDPRASSDDDAHASFGGFRAIDGADGFAFAVGCDYRVARLVRSAVGWRGTAYRLETLRDRIVSNHGYTVVRMLSPDEIIVGATPRAVQIRAQGYFALVRFLEDDLVEVTELSTDLIPYPSRSISRDGSRPSMLVGDPRRELYLASIESPVYSIGRSVGSAELALDFHVWNAAVFHEASDTFFMVGSEESILVARR
ncbi:MAG: hypothetical protein HYV07_02790 [Deltaproteobacteria bacterium]|nr:hypothetical protein [Deltaproteobacteria bacterium]